jgi:hypothetical protein
MGDEARARAASSLGDAVIRLTRSVSVVVLSTLLATAVAGAQPSLESEAMVQFQRAADSYAFAHRQADRRGRENPVTEGAIFTPPVAAAFRSRIQKAGAGCTLPSAARNDFEVPRVNGPATGAGALPPCVAALLPALPPELEYRTAGVALVLTDAHLRIVVDILHAAFP